MRTLQLTSGKQHIRSLSDLLCGLNCVGVEKNDEPTKTGLDGVTLEPMMLMN